MVEERFNIRYRYSQFSVDRNIDKSKVIKLFNDDLSKCNCFEYGNGNDLVKFYFTINEWENDYFGINSVNLLYVDFKPGRLKNVKNGIYSFLNNIEPPFIITIELPSEDIELVQILNDARFRTIETRLHYVNNRLHEFDFKRYKVRDANQQDIKNLKYIALFMRNKYDRFHADWSFDNDDADNYLSTYIENSINGFADIVMVPNQPGISSDSFLTAKIFKDYWEKLNYPISKMVLSAVSSETNKGWYVKLIAEMTFRLQELGAKSIFMTTQSTNIPVLVTWEKHNYKIGRSTHILSLHSNVLIN
jgi:dTDP-4-amino-4,6-dideoxy-D-galactose acyltransferase